MKDALKLALEALEDWDSPMALPAIYAIKEALAQPDYRAVKTYHEGKPVYVSQPEQEPVAWFIDVTTDGLSTQDYQVAAKEYWGNLSICFPLYTTPPKRPWVGLTDEERNYCVETPFVSQQWANIEAKLKELNT